MAAEVYAELSDKSLDMPLQQFEPVMLCTLHIPLRDLCLTEVRIYSSCHMAYSNEAS